jgi:hypothetical protein
MDHAPAPRRVHARAEGRWLSTRQQAVDRPGQFAALLREPSGPAGIDGRKPGPHPDSSLGSVRRLPAAPHATCPTCRRDEQAHDDVGACRVESSRTRAGATCMRPAELRARRWCGCRAG